MKQYKDEHLTYYKIKIKRIREVFGKPNFREYKDKMWCVDCFDFSGRGLSFCEKTLNKLLTTLKEEIK